MYASVKVLHSAEKSCKIMFYMCLSISHDIQQLIVQGKKTSHVLVEFQELSLPWLVGGEVWL
uniref:Uncharacterized protein n=1 Tax=Arundo donax TaxID=35708 RepID=A0A0A9AGY8_ARUDO